VTPIFPSPELPIKPEKVNNPPPRTDLGRWNTGTMLGANEAAKKPPVNDKSHPVAFLVRATVGTDVISKKCQL
jgi:hypothetical protein